MNQTMEADHVGRDVSESNEEGQSRSSQQRLAWAIQSSQRVFPVVAGAKNPCFPGYFERASNNPEILKRWITEEFPNCNFGVLMGGEVYCLDVDTHTADRNGFDSLRRLDVTIPPTFTVSTPRGGKHYYFCSAEDPLRTRKGFEPGLDFIAANSYCLCPWSYLDDYGHYQPHGDIDTLAPVPEWLVEKLVVIDSTTAARQPSTMARLRNTSQTLPLSDEGLAHLRRHLDKIDPNLDRPAWVSVIYACLNTWNGPNERTVSALREWSSQSPTKWNELDFYGVVNGFREDWPNKVGLPHLQQLAIVYPYRKASAIPVPPSLEQEVGRLVTSLVENASRTLRERGNAPTLQHQGTLQTLAEAMVRGLFATSEGFRQAFPLATGMGKTTLCAALCKLIQDQGLNRSLGIYVETIEQAREFRDSLLRLGVSDSSIGLLHTNPKYSESVPAIREADAPLYRFLIACHARARASTRRGASERLLTFADRPRDLVLWDESMIASNGFSERRLEVINAIRAWRDAYDELRAQGRRSPKVGDQASAFVEFLDAAIHKLKDTDDGVISLGTLEGDPSVYMTLVKNVLSCTRSRTIDPSSAEAMLVKVVEYANRGQIRVLQAGNQGAALVQFEPTIDAAYKKVLILDASAPIRELLNYDSTIEIQPCKVSKDYRNVRLVIADALSSKDSFRKNPGHLANYLAEVDLILSSIPADESILFFCHQEYEDEIERFLDKARLARRGEIYVLHWGEHRAVNRYAHCKWMIVVGVLYFPHDAIASRIIAQTGNLEYSLDDAEIRSVHASEQAEMLYQGISRGHSRTTVDGLAGQQTIYLFHPRKDTCLVLPLLKEVMPGLTITEYEPVHLKREFKNSQSEIEIADRIGDFLASASRDTIRIPKSLLSRTLGCDTNSRIWRGGVNLAAEKSSGWQSNSKAFVRESASIKP